MNPPAAPASAPSLADRRQQFRDGKQALVDSFCQSRPLAAAATRLLRGLARHVDHTLQSLWLAHGLPESAALVAVGGYGGTKLGQVCGTPAATAAAYQQVVDRYALRAIEIDPTLAEGYALLSYYPKQREYNQPLCYYDWPA